MPCQLEECTLGIVYALMSTFCWALFALGVKRSQESKMNPGSGYLLVTMVNAITSVALLFLPLPGVGAPGFSLLAFAFFAAAGVLASLLGRWLLFEVVFLFGPARASAWKTPTPVYTLVLAWIFLGERPGVTTFIGITTALLGMALLAWDQQRAGAPAASSAPAGLVPGPSQAVPAPAHSKSAFVPGWRGTRTAILLPIGSGLAFSVGVLARKAGLNLWPDPAIATVIGATAAFAVLLPAAYARGEVQALRRADLHGLAIYSLVGIVATLAHITAFLSLRISPTAVTHMIAGIEPLLTILLGFWLLRQRERISPTFVASVLIVAAGVSLMAL